MPFRPDLRLKQESIAAAGASLVIAGAGTWVGHPVIGGLLAIGAAGVALHRFHEAKRRGRGFIVEAETLAGLKRQCDARAWLLKTDMWFDGVGNLDAVITTSSMTCILEIKSYGGLRAERGRVVRCNRDATSADKELRQAQAQARRVGGAIKSSKPVLPVLWCPKAPRESAVVHEGVLLANGSVELMTEIIAEMDSVMVAGAEGGR